ncbi:MAG: ABC transporter ATP-binding protein [Bacteroidales bacterium]|jgi:subfamily B ATP-binding cassette protein MsbA|nr:ABC transporter ATP-binding protein [Bacteroidales bacterium]
MKKIKSLLRYVFPKYTKYIVWHSIFIIFSIIFSLFSFTMAIPFLGILFDNQPLVTEPVAWGVSMESISHNFNYFLSTIIQNEGKIQALWIISVFVVIAVLFKTGFFYLARFVMIRVRTGIIVDLRNAVYRKLLKLHMGFFTNERKGDIISRMTNDVNEVEFSIVQSIEILFKEPMTIIIYVAALIYLSPELSVFMLILLPLTGLIIGRVGKSLRKKSVVAQDKLGGLISIIEETLSGMRVIKVFNAQNRMNDKFISNNESYNRVITRIWRRRDLASPLSEFLGTLVVVIIMWYGGRMVLSGTSELTSQDFIGYLIVFSQIINPAKTFSNAYYNIQKGLASAERIDFIIQAEQKIKNPDDPKTFSDFNEKIEYRNVSFKYVDDFVLKNVNLTIPKGQTVALVGQSGSGKSTMVDLLPRLHDVNEGQILIDGLDVRSILTHDLREKMGIVNQEPILFNDTIFNNIAFGIEGATQEQVVEAAKIANAHEFIEATPDGYDTVIGDRGSKLSGGQRQRISIARAILANPPILILDEATSALDTESERLVQEAITRVMKNRTSIIIAHRLSTIVHADVICVMQEGEIVEQGSHEQLLALNGVYKKLYDLQTFAE